MTAKLMRVPAPYLASATSGYLTSEMRQYRHAYTTDDNRWLIQRAYGHCGGGWHVVDTTGQHRGESWHGATEYLARLDTLAAAKELVTRLAAG